MSMQLWETRIANSNNDEALRISHHNMAVGPMQTLNGEKHMVDVCYPNLFRIPSGFIGEDYRFIRDSSVCPSEEYMDPAIAENVLEQD